MGSIIKPPGPGFCPKVVCRNKTHETLHFFTDKFIFKNFSGEGGSGLPPNDTTRGHVRKLIVCMSQLCRCYKVLIWKLHC